MSFSDYWENAVLDHLFGKAVYSPPAHIYVGLSLADPLDDGSGLSEPTDASYARVETDPADWTASNGGVIENATDITFPVPTGDWGTVTHGCLFDAASGGNLLACGSLLVPYEILAGPDAPVIAAAGIVVTGA